MSAMRKAPTWGDGVPVVIGAGPAGLAAAHALVGEGRKPVVLERSPHMGGLARTVEYEGHLFDIGGHRFHTDIDAISSLWKDLLGDELRTVERSSRILFEGRTFKYPLDPVEVMGKLGLRRSLLAFMSYLGAKIRPHPGESTFEGWMVNRFGRRLFDTFFRSYTEKVWGIPTHRIPASWAAQRIRGLSLLSALAGLRGGAGNERSVVSRFLYPARGPGVMWERMLGLIEAGGGRVVTEAEVTRLDHREGMVTRLLVRTPAGTMEVVPTRVVSTAPLSRLLRMFEPACPTEILESASTLTHRAFVMAGIIAEGRPMFADQWLYVHEPRFRVGRVQNFRNWSAAMSPHFDSCPIGMEFFCDAGDDLWNMDDAALLRLAREELKALDPGLSVREGAGFVVREPSAYPIYDVGHDMVLRGLARYLEGFKNLAVAGRNGTHRYWNMDEAMRSGIGAALSPGVGLAS